ncbi:MAG TPA: radical SAM family heme chaperone HemW [Pyrinomonadaceae bacterium]|nr:radical SAM family heme chaperone HemW [Pyrinomonadaceae bacterium]
MKAGVYLHIPFCRSRCSYCDFATDVFKNAETVERYVNALVKEIESFSQRPTPDARQLPVDTIYFGGGTPSLLSPAQLEKILDSIYKRFSIEKNFELTMEMNPATVTLETLKKYKNLGVNRASFGAQTFDDRELKRLGRRHTAEDVRETVELLRQADFTNVSFDLIAGLPRQTLADWERNLDEALKLKPEHLSLYLLEIHEGTPLAEQIRSRRQPLPDEDLAGEMYESMLDKTASAGYAQYEISNFSLPGFASRHNSKYWRCEPVFAFGVSAHSFDGARARWANVRDTNRYVSLIENNQTPVAEKNELDPKQLAAEFAFLRLRLTEGLSLGEYENRFGIDLGREFAEDFRRLEDAGLIELDDAAGFLKLTRRGFVFSNEVFALFV